MNRTLYAAAAAALTAAFVLWMAAVLTGNGTTAGAGTVTFGFGVTMTVLAAARQAVEDREQ